MREQLMNLLVEIEEEIQNYEGYDLIGDGLLDSIQLLDLVAEIEDGFGITIPADRMIRENFKTADTILAMIESLAEEAQ